MLERALVSLATILAVTLLVPRLGRAQATPPVTAEATAPMPEGAPDATSPRGGSDDGAAVSDGAPAEARPDAEATEAQPDAAAAEAEAETDAHPAEASGDAEAGTSADAETAAPAPRPPMIYHLVFDIGFSHWLGHTFDAPAGIYTPALTIHAVPVDWLEIVLMYSGSLLEFTIPTAMRTSQIGFVELSLVLRKELRVGGDMLMLGCGPMVGLVYDVLGAGIAFGAEIVGRFLVQLGNALAIGPFIDVRATLYDLPGDPRPFYEVVDGKVIQGHLDAQIQIGAAIAF